MANTPNEQLVQLYPRSNNSSGVDVIILTDESEQPDQLGQPNITMREQIANMTDQDCHQFAILLYMFLFSILIMCFLVIQITVMSPITHKCDYAKSCCQNELHNITSADCQPIVIDWCQNGTSNGLSDYKQDYCGKPLTFHIIIMMFAFFLFIMSWNINKNLIFCRNRYFSR
jgi:hypothetical protein